MSEIQVSSSNEFTVSQFFQKCGTIIKLLLGKWKFIVMCSLVSSGIFLAIAWFTPHEFTARVTVVQEEGRAGGAGSISSLASQIGLDLNVGGNSTMLAGDNVIGLLKSDVITEKVLFSYFDTLKKETLADRYALVYKYKKKWQKKYNQTLSLNETVVYKNNRAIDSVFNKIKGELIKKITVIRIDKKMTFIELSLTLKDELLAKLIAERLVAEGTAFYIETKTRRQRNNIARLQNRADSIENVLNGQTYNAARVQSQTLDINPAYQSAAVNSEVNARDKMMLSAIYGEVVKQLEIQKATLTQEMPLIQVVGEAKLPLKRIKPSKLGSLITGAFLGFLFASFWVFFKDWRKGMSSLNNIKSRS